MQYNRRRKSYYDQAILNTINTIIINALNNSTKLEIFKRLNQIINQSQILT